MTIVKAFEVEPGVGIGPVRLGMTRDQVIEAAAAAGLSCRPLKRWPDRPEVLIVADQVQAYFGSDDHVEAVEAATHESLDFRLRCDGVDLGDPSPTVKARLDELAEADTSDPGFPASFCYLSIGLCLWKDTKPSDWADGPFESVLVQPPAGPTG